MAVTHDLVAYRTYFLPNFCAAAAHAGVCAPGTLRFVSVEPCHPRSSACLIGISHETTQPANLRPYLPLSAYNNEPALYPPLSFHSHAAAVSSVLGLRLCPQHARNRPDQTRPDHLHHHDSARHSRVAAVRSFFSQSACGFEDDLQPPPSLPPSHRRFSSTTIPPKRRGRTTSILLAPIPPLPFSEDDHFDTEIAALLDRTRTRGHLSTYCALSAGATHGSSRHAYALTCSLLPPANPSLLRPFDPTHKSAHDAPFSLMRLE